MFLLYIRARAERQCATLTQAAWYGLIDNGLVIFEWSVRSMHMQVILDSLFARPGFSSYMGGGGGKKGEFRDWTMHKYGVLF